MPILFLLIALIGGALPAYLQPLLGKMILPFLGGTALTWTGVLLLFSGLTCLVALTCVGFVARMSPRKQAGFQLGVCVLSALILIGNIPLRFISQLSELAKFGFFSLAVFLFVMLCWGSIFLMYHWRHHLGFIAKRPVLLFATAYLGVAGGLLAFHLLEPHFPLSVMLSFFEKSIWGYLGLLLVGLSLMMFLPGNLSWVEEQERFEGRKPYLSWVAISFVTSFLLYGFTQLVGTEFTSSPLMWIIPMGVFALSLFIAFLNPYLIPTHIFFILMMLTSIPLIMIHVFGETVPTWGSLALHAAFFASAVMLLHKCLSIVSGRIVSPRFFICFTLGQFLAAFFAVTAPFLFRDYIEHPLVMVAAIGLAALFWRQEITDGFTRPKSTWTTAALPFLAMFGVGLLVVMHKDKLSTQQLLLLSAVMAASLAMLIRVPFLLALGLAGLVLTPHLVTNDAILFKDRSFYGISQVQNWHDFRLYTNGTTIHGAEPLSGKNAVTYYMEEGPVGQFFKAKHDYIQEHPVAIIGLGVGSMTSYMAPRQQVDFYELDPLVSKIAKTYFNYLNDSAADIGIVMGDGRLELAKSSTEYGLVVLDAFSSDAIPTHLLTVEAFETYLSKLRPDGLILANITNRYLGLYPVIEALAAELGLSLARGVSTVHDNSRLVFPTQWVALSRDPVQIRNLNDQKIWFQGMPSKIRQAVWTDDFVDLKSVIRK